MFGFAAHVIRLKAIQPIGKTDIYNVLATGLYFSINNLLKNKTMKNNKIDVVGLAMVIVAIAITVAVVCVLLSKTNDRGKAKEVSNGNIMICKK